MGLYSQHVQSGPIGVIIASADGRIVDANESFLRLLGYSEAELRAGGAPWDSIAAPDRPASDGRAGAPLTHGEWASFDTEYCCRDGQRVPVRATLGLVEGRSGHRVWLIEDLTRERAGAGAGQDPQNRMAESERIGHVGSWRSDLAGNITWSDEARRIFGVEEPMTHVSASYFFTLVHADDRPAVQNWVKACSAGQSVPALDFRVPRPDGSVRYVTARGELRFDASGQPGAMAGTVLDVTERTLADHALRDSHARTQLLIRASNIGLWDWDLLTNEVFFSPEWKEQLGFADHELPNRFEEWESRVHPADLAATMAGLREYLDGRRQTYEASFRLRHRDGSWRWIFTHANVIRDRGGRAVRMMGSHIDVTAQRRADEEQRLVFERITDAFVAVDNDWAITHANEMAGAIVGHDASAMIGMRLWDAIPAVIGTEYEQACLRAMRDQQPEHVEAFLAPFQRWLEAHVYPSSEGLTLYGRDVTERRRTQDALAASESRLRAIIENEPECVKLVGPAGEVLEMNPAGLAMLEADSLEDVRGHGFMQLIAAEYLPAFRQLHQAVMRGESGSLVFEVTGRKGTRRWLETHAVPLRDAAGAVTMLLGLTRDITARRIAEEDLRRSQGDLRALAGRLNLVREEEAKRIARELHDELGQRLTALNMDLFHLEAHETDRSASRTGGWQNVHQLIDHTIGVVQALSSELRLGHLEILGLTAAIQWQLDAFQRNSGLAVSAELPEEIGLVTEAQGTAFLRVLQEALTNVARHAGATRVVVCLRASTESLTLEVRDDGRGISRAQAAARNALGLLGMRERALAVGALLEISGAAGQGTSVRMSVRTSGHEAPRS